MYGSIKYIILEVNGDKNKALSIKEYLDDIDLYLKVLINDLKKIWCMKNPINNNS